MDLIFTTLRETTMKIINSLITIGLLIGAQQAYTTDKNDEADLSGGVGLGIVNEDAGYTAMGSEHGCTYIPH
jgi:hypothetical protein